jgi:hypothetical protein
MPKRGDRLPHNMPGAAVVSARGTAALSRLARAELEGQWALKPLALLGVEYGRLVRDLEDLELRDDVPPGEFDRMHQQERLMARRIARGLAGLDGAGYAGI